MSRKPGASSSAFAQLDPDQSGSLGREEIRAAVASRGLPNAHVQAFIDAADHDGDGRISLSEFEHFCEQREAQLRSVFARLDRNGDGRLTGEEIRAGYDALGVRVRPLTLAITLHQCTAGLSTATSRSARRCLARPR